MTVVGWSLGGVYARELARAYPERVRAVVTLGSPFSGDPAAQQCVAAVRAGRRAQRRRAAGGAQFATSRRCRRWRSGRGATGSWRRAPRADWRMNATRRSNWTATTWRSACRGGRRATVVREINRFLKTRDLARRRSCFGNENTPLSWGMKWIQTPAPLGPPVTERKVQSRRRRAAGLGPGARSDVACAAPAVGAWSA